MGYKLLHIGVPTTQKQEHEEYIDGLKIFLTDPQYSEYSYEYLRFMEGTVFPEIMQFNPHVAIEVDDLEKASEGTEVIFGPLELETSTIMFVIKNNVILELTKFK